MIHFYENKKHVSWNSNDNAKFRLLCTKDWIEITVDDQCSPSSPYPVSVMNGVTCPRCLEILIAKKEAELNAAKERLARAIEIENSIPGETTVEKMAAIHGETPEEYVAKA